SQDGFVVVNVPLNKRNKLAGEPRIISRCFLHLSESGELLEAAQAAVKRELQRNGRAKPAKLLEAVSKTLQDLFYNKTQSRPVILPNIVKM
ncbi:MAG TPA: hypothetical protein VLS48_01185, partial [Anaerolineales bacterium]|nr:hypothetical protein [Anaerolineales bacterium]